MILIEKGLLLPRPYATVADLTGAYLKQYCPPVQRLRPHRPQSADGSSGHLEPEYCHPERMEMSMDVLYIIT